MSNFETYNARVRAIQAYNQPILDDFRTWLEQSRSVRPYSPDTTRRALQLRHRHHPPPQQSQL